MKAIPTVGVLIYKDDKVLLVRHEAGGSHVAGTYGLPAGRLEIEELPRQAAIRELEEETGLITTEKSLHELPIHVPPADLKRKDGSIKRFTITLFLCTDYQGSLQASDETTPLWIPMTEAVTLELEGYTRKMIEEGFTLSKDYE